MVDASQAYILSFPGGGSPAALQTVTTDLGPCNVRRILITWPVGCGGRLFLSIRAAGGFAFPNMDGQFLAFDDYTYAFDVSNQTDSGKWSVVGWNSDLIEHDPIITYEFDYLRGTVTASSVTPVPL